MSSGLVAVFSSFTNCIVKHLHQRSVKTALAFGTLSNRQACLIFDQFWSSTVFSTHADRHLHLSRFLTCFVSLSVIFVFYRFDVIINCLFLISYINMWFEVLHVFLS